MIRIYEKKFLYYTYELYNEKIATTESDEIKDSPYTQLSDVMTNLVDFEDSVIYLNDDISQTTLVDFMIKVRAIISNRSDSN